MHYMLTTGQLAEKSVKESKVSSRSLFRNAMHYMSRLPWGPIGYGLGSEVGLGLKLVSINIA